MRVETCMRISACIRRFSTGAALIWLVAGACAQPLPRLEVLGGYSFLRTHEDLRFAGMTSGSLHGWQSAVKWNLKPRFGLVADASGQYGKVDGFPPGFVVLESGDVKLHWLLVGPEFRLMEERGLSVNVHALAGVMHASDVVFDRAAFTEGRESRNYRATNSDTQFGGAFGGSLDLRLSEALYWRITQLDVVLTRFASTADPNFRVSTGLVYRFGER
jgi:hypothetical protein